MKSNFKKWTLRSYHSIRGWFMLMGFKHGEYYRSKHFPNTRFYYNKGNEFYSAFMANVGFVTYEDQRKRTFKNWEISLFDFKKG